MRITFHGAAGEVTGSQHLLEAGRLKILLDCGLFQGPRGPSRAKNEVFEHRPHELDGVILSHAHIDHCGNLPRLVKRGYRGPVFCTEATADIAELMLLDSARIQEEDARYLAKRLRAGHPSIEPLYTEEDVRALMKRMEPVPFHEWHDVGEGVRIRFSDSGHILGSAITELELPEGSGTHRIVFTGDLGRRGLPLLNNPETVERCDVLITESTYGNRLHPPADDIKTALERIVREASRDGGRVIIPAFSLGRTQQVVYFLNQLVNDGRLPQVPIYVDSPLSQKVTGVYRHYVNRMDTEVRQLLKSDRDPFGFQGLTYLKSSEESRELNQQQGTFVVIAASGMCESGRVVHHLRHSVSGEQNRIVLIGYQAPGTLGRQIQEKRPYVKVFDRDQPLRAKVEILEGLSAHADAEDFKWWFGELAKEGGIGRAYIVHGEKEGAEGVANLLRDCCDEEPVIPTLHQSIEIQLA